MSDNPIREKILQSLSSPIIKALDDEELTPRYLAKKLKAELNAKENKIFTLSEKQSLLVMEALFDSLKVLYPLMVNASERDKQNVKAEINKTIKDFLPNLLIYSKRLIAWDIRQKARVDAHKLRGDYPPEKSEWSGPAGGPIPIKLYDFDDTNFPKPGVGQDNTGK